MCGDESRAHCGIKAMASELKLFPKATKSPHQIRILDTEFPPAFPKFTGQVLGELSVCYSCDESHQSSIGPFRSSAAIIARRLTVMVIY